MVELHILLVFMIIGAMAAIEIKDLVSSVIATTAVGLGLAASFLVLKAPDVAITQMVVEILCLLILICATVRHDVPFTISGRWWTNTLFTVSFIVALLLVGYQAVHELPAFGQPLMKVAGYYLRRGAADTGATNLLAAVLFDYRAYDRLGEAVVIFVALIATLTLMRSSGRALPGESKKEDEGEIRVKGKREENLSLIVRTTARPVARVALIFGLFIILHGHIVHGGGFVGGVIVALSLVLLLVVFGREVALDCLSRSAARILTALGVFVILGLGFLGYGRGLFMANVLPKGEPFEYFSAGLIPMWNLAMGLLTVAGIFGFVMALVSFKERKDA